MILVQMTPLDWVRLEEIDQVGWSNEHACPCVYLKSGRKVAATLFAGAGPTQDDKALALVEHLNAAWRKAAGLDVFDEPRLAPVPHGEGAKVRDATSGRLIVHDTAGAHSDDARAVERCSVCTPDLYPR